MSSLPPFFGLFILVIILAMFILSLFAYSVYRVSSQRSAFSKEGQCFIPRPLLLRTDILEHRKVDLEKGLEPCEDKDSSKISQPISLPTTRDLSPNNTCWAAPQKLTDNALVNAPQGTRNQTSISIINTGVEDGKNELHYFTKLAVISFNDAARLDNVTKETTKSRDLTNFDPRTRRVSGSHGSGSKVSPEYPKDGESCSMNTVSCKRLFPVSPFPTDCELHAPSIPSVLPEAKALDKLPFERVSVSDSDSFGNMASDITQKAVTTDSQSVSDLSELSSSDELLSTSTDGISLHDGPTGMLSATVSNFDWGGSESILTSLRESAKVTHPTFPSFGVLRRPHRTASSVGIAKIALLCFRFALQRDPEASIYIPKPIDGNYTSYRRATAPLSHIPEPEPRTPTSIRKEIRCKALRCSPTPYRPGLSSPLTSAVAICGSGCPAVEGVRRVSRERIMFIDWSDYIADQDSASELLIEVLRKSCERRRIAMALDTGPPGPRTSNEDPFGDDHEIRSVVIPGPDPLRLALEQGVLTPTTGAHTLTETKIIASDQLSALHSLMDSGRESETAANPLSDQYGQDIESATTETTSIEATLLSTPPSPSRETDTSSPGSPTISSKSRTQPPSTVEQVDDLLCSRSRGFRVSTHQRPEVPVRNPARRRRSVIVGPRADKDSTRKAIRKDAKLSTSCSRRGRHKTMPTTVEGVLDAMTRPPRRVSPPLVGGSPWIRRTSGGTDRARMEVSKPLTAPMRKSALHQQENLQPAKRTSLSPGSISHTERRSLSDISTLFLNAQSKQLLDSSELSASAMLLEESLAHDSSTLSRPKQSFNPPVTSISAPTRPSRSAIPPGSIILSSDTIL